MKSKHAVITILRSMVFALGIATASQCALAQDAAKAPRKDVVLKGDAQCTRCHDENEEVPVLAIGKTKHGTLADWCRWVSRRNHCPS